MKQKIVKLTLRLTITVLVALFLTPYQGFTSEQKRSPVYKIVSPIPVIEQFTAGGAQCRITQTGLLYYLVKNRIKRIEIFALYYDGRKRRFYNRVLVPIRNTYSQRNIADPGMERGVSGYSIKVTNERGFIAKRKLDFKTPKVIFFRLKSRTMSKRILEQRGNNYAKVTYSIPIQHKNIQKIVVNGTRYPPNQSLPFRSINAHFNTERLWFSVIWGNSGFKDMVRFKVHGIGNDGCRKADWLFTWNAVLPADR